jgi:shikimate kinase
MVVRAVFLVGFMASGKTSVGRELARRLNWDFLDLDALVESRECKSVAGIFRDHGEPHFRQAETDALRDLMPALQRNTVVALGGGAFLREQNRQLLREWPSVFLDAPAEELWRRCCGDPAERPLGRNQMQFAQLYRERLPFYRTAKVTVETSGRDVSAICAEIEGTLNLHGSSQNGSATFRTGESS